MFDDFPPDPPLAIDVSQVDPSLCLMWTRMALAVTAHRYFLHIDPILSGILGLENAERAIPLTVQHANVLMRSRKSSLLQTLADTLGSQSAVVLAGYGADGIDARAVYPEDAGDVGHLLQGFDVSTLTGALKLLKGSLLHDVVSLGSRLFYQTPLLRTPAISALYALVALSPGGTVDEWAAAIAGTACRNVFMGFLLARNVCENKSESSPQERLSALESTFGDLADWTAINGVKLALGVNDGSGAVPKRIEMLVATLDNIPAADFVRALSASPQRFRRYVGGLGIGQS